MSADDNNQDLDLNNEHLPQTPPTPDALDPESKGSRKREREVSIEPPTPREEEVAPRERKEPPPTPLTKKNRVRLDSTTEEPETPPHSPRKSGSPVELSTSPPHETKVRLIRERVRGLNWEDESTRSIDSLQTNGDIVPSTQHPHLAEPISLAVDTSVDVNNDDTERTSALSALSAADASEVDHEIEPAEDDSVVEDSLVVETQPPPPTEEPTVVRPDSDSEDQDKNLKRKLGDRAVSVGAETTKRARDGDEEDANPRDRKRPTPPPEERKETPDVIATVEPPPVATPPTPNAVQGQIPAATPKPGGFLSYASTSSPFATTKGPSVFGGSSGKSPLPSPNAGPSSVSSGARSPLSPSPFVTAVSQEPSLTGTKRTGFEAFASSTSPFIVPARSKSPTGFATKSGLNRSKSPQRSSRAAISAFSSYSSGISPFAVPPVKKQRQEGSGSEAGDGEKNTRPFGRNGSSTDASEDESDKQTSFGERLRASKSEEDTGPTGSDEDESKANISEQELTTGEEDEETIFQVRSKLFKLSNQNSWQERGTGLLKLNVRRSDGGGARLVMRKEAVFNLLLNATLFKGMKCSLAQDPRYVRFSVIESGTTTSHYNLRLANAKVASELLEEINANIPGDDHDGGV
ncbi:hypothetical protein BD410DRAFT_786955 [Rickenella mellea]|uniref:RanBD1 domain-containing protein n=1 Tax=Rickenella mellea TaxID=50990 RepID=A0A4Y7Q8M8_9AGAM|nr:hypothetical protein BD410DRAFT_786955 [Rickenella mellea]